jgi:hypothetical protein
LTTADGLGSRFTYGVYASVLPFKTTVYVATFGGLSIANYTGGRYSFTNYTNANTNGQLGPGGVTGVYATGGKIYAATNTYGGNGGVSTSINNGLNWTTYTNLNSSLGGNGVNGVHAIGSSIYAATGGGVSISTNDGANWITYTNANTNGGVGDDGVSAVYAVGDGGPQTKIYAATNGGLSISTNNGLTWTNKPGLGLGGFSQTFDVYAVGSTVYVATGGVSISPDGGTTWNNYTNLNTNLADNNARAIYVSGGTIYVGTVLAGLAVSTDGGLSWTSYRPANSGLGADYIQGAFAAGGTVYAATDGGGLSIGALT